MEGMGLVGYRDDPWEKTATGLSYTYVNSIYHDLADALGIDLWTLDALWWVIKKE